MINRGFTLLPDYACTAHMVQGMTLHGLLADCGGVRDRPGVKNMLAAYATLSRVATSDGMRILRTFPKALFAKGSPPGHTCLMRLLRSRLGHTMEHDCDYESAAAAFGHLPEETKANVRGNHDTWACSLCLLEMCATMPLARVCKCVKGSAQ